MKKILFSIIFLATITVIAQTPKISSQAIPKAYFSFASTNGTKIFDSIGGNIGTFANSAGSFSGNNVYVAPDGRFGSCLRFTNVGPYVITTLTTPAPTNSAFTFTCWVRNPANPIPPTVPIIFGSKDAGNVNLEWAANIATEWIFSQNAGTMVVANFPAPMLSNSWHFLAMTEGFVSPFFVWSIYYDGKRIGTSNNNSAVAINLAIRTLSIGAATATGHFFTGDIDDFRYWDRRLTDAEIAALYFERKVP